MPAPNLTIIIVWHVDRSWLATLHHHLSRIRPVLSFWGHTVKPSKYFFFFYPGLFSIMFASCYSVFKFVSPNNMPQDFINLQVCLIALIYLGLSSGYWSILSYIFSIRPRSLHFLHTSAALDVQLICLLPKFPSPPTPKAKGSAMHYVIFDKISQFKWC